MNNNEISGVPESKSENVIDIVMKLGEKTGCLITEADIDACHRVAHRESSKKPRNIIAKFVLRHRKAAFLAAVKSGCPTAADLGYRDCNERIFANDHLTLKNKILYKKAREFAKSSGYRFCWTRESKIFIRKSENAKLILVKDEATLSRLVANSEEVWGSPSAPVSN